MLINLPPRRVMAKASPTFGVSETTIFGGYIIPSDLAVATLKCGYCRGGYGMITGLMATLHGTFQLLAAVGQWREMGFPNLIVQWTNVAALCVHSYDMRKEV
jgi:hypothetical protein